VGLAGIRTRLTGADLVYPTPLLIIVWFQISRGHNKKNRSESGLSKLVGQLFLELNTWKKMILGWKTVFNNHNVIFEV